MHTAAAVNSGSGRTAVSANDSQPVCEPCDDARGNSRQAPKRKLEVPHVRADSTNGEYDRCGDDRQHHIGRRAAHTKHHHEQRHEHEAQELLPNGRGRARVVSESRACRYATLRMRVALAMAERSISRFRYE